jgi:sugar lactone lactonase YvrE
MEFRAVSTVVCALGESPVWDERRGVLFHEDLKGRALHVFDPARGDLTPHGFDSEVCALGLAESGRLVVALRREVVLYDPDRREAAPLARFDFPAHMRLNDGKVGPDGAFWVGSMDERPEREPIGVTYRVTADGAVAETPLRARVSNGLAWSPDGRTMWRSCSRTPFVATMPFDPATGALGPERRIAAPDEATGRPDGAAMDAHGVYWSAGVSAGVLNRIGADGTILERIPVPVAAPTMPCFGGPDLKTLYVTSHRETTPERLAEYPLTGRLVAARAPVGGAPVHRFRGA